MNEKINIEELEKQCLEAEKNFKTLHEQLAQAKKEEKEERDAKLRAEVDARYKEVIDAYDKFAELRRNFVNDYGYFTFRSEKNGLINSIWDLFN